MPRELLQARFDLRRCFLSGVPLLEPIIFGDNIRILRSGDKGDCWAAVAIEVENREELTKKTAMAEESVTEIANLYAFVSSFSIHSEYSGSEGMQSLDDLGKPPKYKLAVAVESRYSKEQLEKYQRKLMENWELTKRLWSKLQARLRDKNGQFLRVALIYHYQSGLPPAIPLEEAFIDAAIGLEALYNESPQDISHKLAVRGALILSCSGEKENYFLTLKELYNKRNKIVHGTGETIEYDDLQKIRGLLRKSIRLCLALGLDKNKADIIKFIDRALIEPDAREELKKEIAQQSADLFS